MHPLRYLFVRPHDVGIYIFSHQEADSEHACMHPGSSAGHLEVYGMHPTGSSAGHLDASERQELCISRKHACDICIDAGGHLKVNQSFASVANMLRYMQEVIRKSSRALHQSQARMRYHGTAL